MDRPLDGELAHETIWIEPDSCMPLFGVKPVGGNTLVVESLLSWLIRLAREHAVSPRELLREVAAAHAPKVSALCYASFFRRHGVTVNGLGRYAELFVETFTVLSGAEGLESHTLLPWKFILTGQGSPLIHPAQRWCPQCLADMLGAGIEPYRLLLWSLWIVEICPFHKTALRQRCPHCGVAQPAIPRWPDIVYCDVCRRTLLEREMAEAPHLYLYSDRAAEDRLWRVYAAADLLRCSATLGGPESPQRLRTFLREISVIVGLGNRAEVCRLAGLPTRALNKWLAGTDRPSLPSLLRLLRALDCWPSEALRGYLVANSSFSVVVSRPGCQERPRRQPARIRVEALLKAIWSGDPPPLTALAKSMGVTRSGLKYRFPVECRAIVEIRLAKRRARTAEKRDSQVAAVAQIMLRLRQGGMFPGRKRVEAEARKMGLSLLTPDLKRVFQRGLIDSLRM